MSAFCFCVSMCCDFSQIIKKKKTVCLRCSCMTPTSLLFLCECVCVCLQARSYLIPSCHGCDASAQEAVGLWEWQNCTDCETGDERREERALLTLAQHLRQHTYSTLMLARSNQSWAFQFIYSHIYIPWVRTSRCNT